MGGGIAGPVSLVQTKARTEFQKVGHGCAEVMGVWRPRIFSHIHIGHDDAAFGIHVIPVETGPMIDVLADDVEIPHGRRVSLASGGDGGFRDTFTALHEDCALFAEIDEDCGFSAVGAGRLATGETARGGKEQEDFME